MTIVNFNTSDNSSKVSFRRITPKFNYIFSTFAAAKNKSF